MNSIRGTQVFSKKIYLYLLIQQLANNLFIRSQNLSPDTDRELVLKYRNSHESKYIGELFERYTHLVFGVGLKYLKDQDEAKDMVMEVFEKLLTELKRHNVKNFKSWIHTVAKNYCLMKLRKEEPKVEFLKESKKMDVHLMENPTIEHLNSEEALYEAVDKAVEKLGEEQKRCIQLFYFENKTYQQKVNYNYKMALKDLTKMRKGEVNNLTQLSSLGKQAGLITKKGSKFLFRGKGYGTLTKLMKTVETDRDVYAQLWQDIVKQKTGYFETGEPLVAMEYIPEPEVVENE